MYRKTLSLELIAAKINSLLMIDDKIEAAYLLGSIVSGRLHPQSDIDLAILPVDPSFTHMDAILGMEGSCGILCQTWNRYRSCLIKNAFFKRSCHTGTGSVFSIMEMVSKN